MVEIGLRLMPKELPDEEADEPSNEGLIPVYSRAITYQESLILAYVVIAALVFFCRCICCPRACIRQQIPKSHADTILELEKAQETVEVDEKMRAQMSEWRDFSFRSFWG